MADLTESQKYESGIYQLETTDPVVAGPEGISNLQARQLANRTAWLKQQVDQLIAEMGGLGIDEVSGLQSALNGKLGLTAKAADSELLDGRDGKIYAPPGAVIAFAASSPPVGWLECNGATISRTTYADLYAAISTVFGAGNGTTTFKLPDLRGEFIRGFDNGRGIDNGRSIGSYQAGTKIPGEVGLTNSANSHTIHDINNVYGDPVYETSFQTLIQYRIPNATVGSGSSYWRTVRPRNIAMLFCIKY